MDGRHRARGQRFGIAARFIHQRIQARRAIFVAENDPADLAGVCAMPELTRSRIALVHDWLTGMRGGEKVLEVLCDLLPAADIFTLVHLPGKVSPTIEKHNIVTSSFQKIPGIARLY